MIPYARYFYFTSLVFAIILQPAPAAVGIYNWKISTDSDSSPIHLEYRLNCDASVGIKIIDDAGNFVVNGPYTEKRGINKHDDLKYPMGGKRYRAEISATSTIGTYGDLVPVVSHIGCSIYGLAVDTCDASPGYGNIYITDLSTEGGRIWSYYADGTTNTEFGNSSGYIDLGFVDSPVATAPWGIAVAPDGKIYVASKSVINPSPGIRIFDHMGNPAGGLLPGESQNISYLAATSSSNGTELYETYTDSVKSYSIANNTKVNAIIPPSTDLYPKQIAFEPDGKTCYVAYKGSTSGCIARYTRTDQTSWAQDKTFNCGISAGNMKYIMGVSCDAKSSVSGKSSTLWIGLFASGILTKGNVCRKNLATGELQPFRASSLDKARFVASDSVGNVVIEYGSSSLDIECLYKAWGLYMPGGETTSDVRLTDWVTLASAASPELVSSISDVLKKDNGCLVELIDGKIVSAVFADGFYICEPDRFCGIKIQGSAPVIEGTLVKVCGELDTVAGERIIKNAQVL